MSPPLLIPQFPPRWAEVFGEDRKGIFAECSVEAVRFVWRWIPPGRFWMGSPKDEVGRWADEGPEHEVTISNGFWLGETLVTQTQWRALREWNPSHFTGDSLPVEQVSHSEVLNFCEALAQRCPSLHPRLPTEAEWEYACRAGTQSAFNDGSPCSEPTGYDAALDLLGWFVENSAGRTVEVKRKSPNSWGLYDMHGNVWEWCADEMRDYHALPAVDRSDPLKGTARAIRGGAWNTMALQCRTAFRNAADCENRIPTLGFRLAAGQPREPQITTP